MCNTKGQKGTRGGWDNVQLQLKEKMIKLNPFNSQELKYPRELKTWIKKKKKLLKILSLCL